MILVDTNIVSEAMRASPHAAVTSWLDRQAPSTLFLSSISLSELLLGIALLPDGRRKSGMSQVLNVQIEAIFGDRILPFDENAARAYARIISEARTKGYAISIGDGQIAAIATVHRLTVATRDVAPFQAASVAIIDPWSSSAHP